MRPFSKLLVATLLLLPLASHATLLTGNISNWPESGPLQVIGDGTNSVSMFWSINTFDLGFFYGSGFTGDSDVAHAVGVTDISQISDASLFNYVSGGIGPFCDADCDPAGVGEFMVWRNINSGHYGVLRVDNIIGGGFNATLDGTWWFQPDGTGNFSGTVPEPATLTLFGLALAGLGFSRRRKV